MQDIDDRLREYFKEMDRRQHPIISEEIIEDIAERAAEKALERMEIKLYQRVGKTFVTRVFQFIGVILISAAYYLNSKGFLSFHD